MIFLMLQLPEVTLDTLQLYRSRSASALATAVPSQAVFIAQDMAAVLQPMLVDTKGPSFGVFRGVEDSGAVVFRLPGYDPENQMITAHIVDFPKHGRLYQVLEDGSVGDALPVVSSVAAETLVTQYAVAVVDMSPEWGSTDGWLRTANMTIDDVTNAFVQASLNRSSTNPLSPMCYCGIGALGPPDCPVKNADCGSAWNPLDASGEAMIILEYATPVFLTEVS